MLPRPQLWLRLVAALLMIVALVFGIAPRAFAEDGKRPSPLADVMKGIVFDPTTYAPAVISYDATMRDWNTSQPFFHNGFMEHNSRFTITGRPDDMPLSYTVGRTQIFKDTAAALGVAAIQNASSRIVERALLARYPEHHTAIKTVGWIQRISIASLMSYHLAAPHYRQAQLNSQRAAELGLR
jgi:hypothetical protein